MSSIKVNCGKIEISNDNKSVSLQDLVNLRQSNMQWIWLAKYKKLQKNLAWDLYTKLLLIKPTEQVLKAKEEQAWKLHFLFLIKLKKN